MKNDLLTENETTRNKNAEIKDDFIHCFGEFDMNRHLCRKHCGMRIQCALERLDRQRLREIEEMEEIMDSFELNQCIQ